MSAGRRSKYTPEIVERICSVLADGNTRRTAAAVVGIDENTLLRWIHRHADFAERVKTAEQEAVRRNVAIIQRAAERTWQAAAWWLERRFPDEFGQRPKQAIELSGPEGGPVQHEHETCIPDSAIIALADYIRARSGGDSPEGQN